MKQYLNNIWDHPKTSAAGLLLMVVTITGILSGQGITLGNAGTGTVVALISAIAAGLLGLIARDPVKGADYSDILGSKPKAPTASEISKSFSERVDQLRCKSSSTARFGALALIALIVPMPFMAGCTAGQVNDVVAKISAFLPTAVSLTNEALTIYGAVESTSTGADQSTAYSALQAVQADLTALEKPLKDYLQATSTQSKNSAWMNIEAAIDTATSDADTLLTAAAVKNGDSQKQGVVIIASLDAAIHVIDGYVSSTMSTAQVQAKASRRQVKLETVSRYWSQADKREIGRAFGVPYRLAFERAEAAGF